MVVVLLAACGGTQPVPANGGGAGGSAEPVGVVTDTRTEIEKQRDAACDELAPRITQCAVADARADLAAGKTTQREFELDTAPDLLRKHTEKFLEQCKVDLSSRQVRVLQVCGKVESECGPLIDCLGHLDDHGP